MSFLPCQIILNVTLSVIHQLILQLVLIYVNFVQKHTGRIVSQMFLTGFDSKHYTIFTEYCSKIVRKHFSMK